MGRQGGIARFTGSVGDLNCYFDEGMEIARRKPWVSKRRWKTSPAFRQQRAAAEVFGAASVVASQVWGQLPAGMRRLGDSSAYGRFVGAVRDLMAPDPGVEGPSAQLWDADLLTGFDLNLDCCGQVSVSGQTNHQLNGLDVLLADLDAALGGAAGSATAKFVVAHPFWGDGLAHLEGMPAWRGGKVVEKTVARGGAVREFEYPKGAWGQQPEGSGRLSGPTPVPENFVAPQRRVRVWVHACEVVETVWHPVKQRFVLPHNGQGSGSGFVTDWLVLDGRTPVSACYAIQGRELVQDWMDGSYLVFTAVEVSEKRGRHWVRLPYCCGFGVNGQLVMDDGGLVMDDGRLRMGDGRLRMEDGGLVIDDGGLVMEDGGLAAPNPSGLVMEDGGLVIGCAVPCGFGDGGLALGRRMGFRGKVGYLDADGQVVVVEGWPEVGRELKVWALEDLLPKAVLVAVEAPLGAMDGDVQLAGDCQVDVGLDGVLVEAKAGFRVGLDLQVDFYLGWGYGFLGNGADLDRIRSRRLRVGLPRGGSFGALDST